MKERTNDVLLQYFEQTLSDGLTLQELLRAAADAFTGLLNANAVYFLTKESIWLQPAGPEKVWLQPADPADGEGPPDCAEKTRKGGWSAAPPGRELLEKIETCMAKKAGRSVCVCKKDSAGMAWWLFWLETEHTVCGAAVCAVPVSPDEEVLSGAHRLARCIAPRFAALIKKQKERPLSSLPENTAAMLSHEFKTPLTVALSSLQLLRRKLKAENMPEGAEKYLDYTELNLYKALHIAMNLVEAQDAQPGGRLAKPEYTDLIKTLGELVAGAQPYAEVTGAQLLFENRADEPCGLVCDVFYLERVLLNLLSNAMKHAPQNSSIRMVLEQKDDALLIHVEDEGPGIPDGACDRIFEKFWRGPNERTGTGLGLYLSQHFAQKMGGVLRAENRPQGGARFTLSLPLSAAECAAALHSTPLAYHGDSRDALLRIEFSELLSQKCI